MQKVWFISLKNIDIGCFQKPTPIVTIELRRYTSILQLDKNFEDIIVIVLSKHNYLIIKKSVFYLRNVCHLQHNYTVMVFTPGLLSLIMSTTKKHSQKVSINMSKNCRRK